MMHMHDDSTKSRFQMFQDEKPICSFWIKFTSTVRCHGLLQWSFLSLGMPTELLELFCVLLTFQFHENSVEKSPSLAKKQIATVGEVQSHLSKFRVECRDAADPSGWGPELSELYNPVQDQLITSCIVILDLEKTTHGCIATSIAKKMRAKLFPKPQIRWLPTGCLKLLEVLHGALPKMSLIASDFSYLPDVNIPGERAPLVSVKRDGSSFDYNNYLDAKGDADIFFPTDFLLLERMDHHCSGWLKPHENKLSKKGKKRRTIMVDTSAFMEEFGVPSMTRTRDGYNPLLDDFKNTKIYLSVPTHNIK